MSGEKESGVNVGLVAKILVASGLLFSLVGVFLILFVSVTAGVVLLLAGLCDLGASVFLSRSSKKNG